MLDGAKLIRDEAIKALVTSVKARDLQRLDVEHADRSGVVILPRRVVKLTEPQRLALCRWLAIRPLVADGSQALFVNLHWQDARARPGTRLSYNGLLKAIGGVRRARSRT